MTTTAELQSRGHQGCQRLGRPRTTWWRTAEKERERAGERRPLQQLIELVGDRVLRPYAPLSVK